MKLITCVLDLPECEACGQRSVRHIAREPGSEKVNIFRCRRCGADVTEAWADIQREIVIESSASLNIDTETCTSAKSLLTAISVLEEVEHAVAKFPTWPSDPLHALAILGEEYGELVKDMLQMTYEPHKTDRDKIKNEAIQTAAMAIRLLMSLPYYSYEPSKQHEQSGPA